MSAIDIEADVKEIERLLSRPGQVPNEFATWITKWLTVNMDISTYQLRGLANTFFKAAPVINASEFTASGTMVDLATVGPTLSGLPNGKYLAFWGANMKTSGPDAVGLMSVATNMFGPSDDQAAKGRTFGGSDIIPIVYSRDFTLDGVDQNFIQAKYMRAVAGGNPGFEKRWLVAVMVERV